MFDPPAGYADLLSDAEDVPDVGPFRELFIDDDVGTVRARKPMPKAVSALSSAANAKIGKDAQVGYLNQFALSHLAEGEYERLLVEMSFDRLPEDTVQRVVRGIATWGTARPTVPSSHSH